MDQYRWVKKTYNDPAYIGKKRRRTETLLSMKHKLLAENSDRRRAQFDVVSTQTFCPGYKFEKPKNQFTMSQAKAACKKDSACTGIYSYHCTKQAGSWRFCQERRKKRSGKSCTIWK